MSKTLGLLCAVSAVYLSALSADSKAQINLGIGIRGGISNFEDPIGSGPQLGGHVRVKAAPKVDVEVMAELFSSSWNENQWEVRWRNVLIGVTGSYNFSLPTKTVIPYLGAGMCLHQISKEFSSGAFGITPPAKESSSEGCFHALGGLKFNLTAMPISIFVEGRYMAVGDEQTPNFPTLLGGLTLDILR
ncbi:MAG: hypothetical protein ACE5H0_04890 [Bacteroidota bacterium]